MDSEDLVDVRHLQVIDLREGCGDVARGAPR